MYKKDCIISDKLTKIARRVNTTVTTGGTEGKTMCSDRPTRPLVIDACLMAMSFDR